MYLRWLRKWSFVDSYIVLFHLFVFFCFVYYLDVKSAMLTSKSVRDSLTSPTTTAIGFDDVTNNSRLFFKK